MKGGGGGEVGEESKLSGTLNSLPRGSGVGIHTGLEETRTKVLLPNFVKKKDGPTTRVEGVCVWGGLLICLNPLFYFNGDT